MARKFGNIFTAIWRDRDFVELPALVQRAYLVVITQPDVSSCGVLPLMPSRWAKYAPDTDTDSLWECLSVLHSKRYLIADSDSDELLIRSFIKYDGGYNNGKRLPAILAATNGVISDTLRQVTVHELDKLGVAHRLPDRPLDSLSDSLLHRLWHSPRIPVTLRTNNRNPETIIQKPETPSPATPSMPSDFDRFWSLFPRKVGKQAAVKAFTKAIKAVDAETVIDACRRFAADPNLPEKQFIPHPATWLNEGRWDDEPMPDRHLTAVPRFEIPAGELDERWG